MTYYARLRWVPFALFLVPAVSAAEGLSTSFVDVVVMDAPLGSPKRVEDSKGNSLVLRNLGENVIHVEVQVLTPDPNELRPPAEPIPDTGWIRIVPDRLELGPKETAQCSVVISLPKKKNLRNRIFQAMIWSRGQPAGEHGMTVSAGLKSRLRIQTVKH